MVGADVGEYFGFRPKKGAAQHPQKLWNCNKDVNLKASEPTQSDGEPQALPVPEHQGRLGVVGGFWLTPGTT